MARWDRPSLGTTGHAGWCTLEAAARPRAGYPGTGLASGGGVHPCDYEMGSNGTRLALRMLRGIGLRELEVVWPQGCPRCRGEDGGMGLKAAAHEQRMAGWCIGMPCEHYVCGCESATYGVRVAAPDAGLVCELRSRSVLGLSSLVRRDSRFELPANSRFELLVVLIQSCCRGRPRTLVKSRLGSDVALLNFGCGCFR